MSTVKPDCPPTHLCVVNFANPTDIAHTKPDSFQFENSAKVVFVKSWKELYVGIVKELYGRDPKPLKSLVGEKIIKTGRTVDILDASQQKMIRPEIFGNGSEQLAIETNRSASAIITRIKKLLDLYNIPDSLKITYHKVGGPVPVNGNFRAFLSFLDAAEKILSAGNTPMHYTEITQKALRQNLIKTKELTPEATMYAQILNDIQRRKKQGKTPCFEKLGKGMVGLAVWTPPGGILSGIGKFNVSQREALKKNLTQLNPKDFERLISFLLIKMGFSEVRRTPYGGDGGVDVRGIMTVHDAIHIKMAVQAKRWKHKVHAPVVQQFRSSLGTDERGAIVTTSSFSEGAKEEATRVSSHAPIDLIDGDQLISLLVEYDLGVKKRDCQLLELTPSFFPDEEE